MRANKKLIVSLSALLVVMAAVITVVVAIFAAASQGVKTTFRVKYTAVDVSATVRANFIVGETSTPMLTEDNQSYITFRPNHPSYDASLSPNLEEIEIEASDGCVVFEYIFTNDSNSVEIAIDLDVTEFVAHNMDVSYAYSYSKITDTSNMATTSSFEPTAILGKERENEEFSTLYVYVKISISNYSNDASFEGDMRFSLTQTESVKLDFENVSGALNSLLFETRYIPINTNIEELPKLNFGDSKYYAWFEDSELTTMFAVPFKADKDLLLYAGETSYLSFVSTDGTYTTTVVENIVDDKIYISAPTGASFTYDKTQHKITGEKYIVVESGKNVKIIENSATSNVVVLTEKPADIDTKLFYSAYGEYPQAYVGTELNEILKNASLTETSEKFTTDINGTTTELKVYLYDGKKYAKLENSKYYRQSNFSTGETVANDVTYFFHIEPIVASAMQKNVNGTYTMMTVNILGSQKFDSSKNTWETSSIRQYLNGVFLQESGLSNIVIETTIENNVQGNFEDGSGVSTTDSIWLASAEEILTWSGVGDEVGNLKSQGSITTNSTLRIKNVSDLAIATYSSVSNSNCNYYLRSIGGTSDRISYVNTEGVIYASQRYTYTYNGFCPTFAVNL